MQKLLGCLISIYASHALRNVFNSLLLLVLYLFMFDMQSASQKEFSSPAL